MDGRVMCYGAEASDEFNAGYELCEQEKYNNLTNCQTVASEGWDLRWEIDRLGKMLESRDKEIGSLRFDIAVLKAELNATRGRQNG